MERPAFARLAGDQRNLQELYEKKRSRSRLNIQKKSIHTLAAVFDTLSSSNGGTHGAYKMFFGRRASTTTTATFWS